MIESHQEKRRKQEIAEGADKVRREEDLHKRLSKREHKKKMQKYKNEDSDAATDTASGITDNMDAALEYSVLQEAMTHDDAEPVSVVLDAHATEARAED